MKLWFFILCCLLLSNRNGLDHKTLCGESYSGWHRKDRSRSYFVIGEGKNRWFGVQYAINDRIFWTKDRGYSVQISWPHAGHNFLIRWRGVGVDMFITHGKSSILKEKWGKRLSWWQRAKKSSRGNTWGPSDKLSPMEYVSLYEYQGKESHVTQTVGWSAVMCNLAHLFGWVLESESRAREKQPNDVEDNSWGGRRVFGIGGGN